MDHATSIDVDLYHYGTWLSAQQLRRLDLLHGGNGGNVLAWRSSSPGATDAPPPDLVELSGANNDGAVNLAACTGECDNDGQCAPGLKCFQRSNGESIPGCRGPGSGKGWDYCHDPARAIGAKHDSYSLKRNCTVPCCGKCHSNTFGLRR